MLRDLMEPADRGLTDDLYVSPGSLKFLANAADELGDLAMRLAGTLKSEKEGSR